MFLHNFMHVLMFETQESQKLRVSDAPFKHSFAALICYTNFLTYLVWAEGLGKKCYIPFNDKINDACTIFNNLAAYLRTQVSMQKAIK